MPSSNEHSALQLPPERFSRFARARLAPSVSAVLGIDERGTSHVQSLIFDRAAFTAGEASEWLEQCGFRAEVEPAANDGDAVAPS